jgi:hypothetical protein
MDTIYGDSAKLRRRTGLRRRVNPKADGFLRKENADFEYSD